MVGIGRQKEKKMARDRGSMSPTEHQAKSPSSTVGNTDDSRNNNVSNTTAPWGLVEKVVSPFVECVDVDGILRRIDVNDVVSRIDIDQVVDRIDMNRLLDRINWDRQLQRVDFEAILSRIDVEHVVMRSNVGAVITQSTAGIFTTLLDAIRSIVVVLDLWILQVSRRCLFRKHAGCLPQRPGGNYDDNHLRVPPDRVDKAIAVQGRYTGGFSKALAICIDIGVVTGSFGMLLILFEISKLIWENHGFQNISIAETYSQSSIARDDNLYTLVAYCIHWSLYFFLAILLTDQTLGMAIVGTKVVSTTTGSLVDGEPDPPSIGQILIRTACLPASVTLLPPLGIIGACRRDGRMLHDLMARTGTVYRWNARLTKLRARANHRLQEQSSVYTMYHPSDYSANPIFSPVRTPLSRDNNSSNRTFLTARDDYSCA